ncbi:phosphotransferase [Specibacter sp. RAF43]|uniref:phosphotransferase n=1 Tax=Specibacter sp. RAF43 TaxID=3233057 RepID=UPI003F978E69
MIDVSEDLPTTPEEITSEWLSTALSSTMGPVVVESTQVTKIIWGNATKVCIDVTYGPGTIPADLPASFCVKGGLDSRLGNIGSTVQYILEANFYGALRENFATALPTSYYAGINADESQGIIILEDMNKAGVRFVDAGETLTVDQVASGLEEQAAWHSATWGQGLGDLPRLAIGGPDRTGAKMFFSEKYWNRHFSEEGAPALPPAFQDREKISAAFNAMWSADDVGMLCLQHGDAHLGNTYLDQEGKVGFIDWQAYFLGPWSYDVATFLSGALTIEDRRNNEEALLKHYLELLSAGGGEELSFKAAHSDYRRHLLRGFLWAVSPSIMQPFERSRIMSERHLTAMEDNGTLGQLGY